MKTKLLFPIIFLVVSIFSSAYSQEFPAKMREKVKQLMVWKLTDRLNLTKEQSEKFFPLLNEFLDANETLIEERRGLLKELSDKESKLSDSELNEKSSRILQIDRERAENMIKFSKDSEKILTARQKADLVVFQTEFARDLAKMIEKRRKNQD